MFWVFRSEYIVAYEGNAVQSFVTLSTVVHWNGIERKWVRLNLIMSVCDRNDFSIKWIFQECRIYCGQVVAIGSNYSEFTENTVRAKCRIVVVGFGSIDWWRGGTLLWRIVAQHRWVHLHLADTAILIFVFFSFNLSAIFNSQSSNCNRLKSVIKTLTTLFIRTNTICTI